MRRKKYIIIFLVAVVLLSTLSFIVLNLRIETRAKILRLFPIAHYALQATKPLDIFYLPLMVKETEIETWDLKVSEKDLSKILSEIPKDFRDESYIDRKKIDADLNIDDQDHKARIGVKGVTPAHWAWDKKSWSVNFDKDERYLGIDKLNLIVPKNVGFYMEAFNKYRAQKLDLAVPYHGFVNITINGQNKALYYFSERWSAEFLARSGKPDNTNMYSDNNTYLFGSVDGWHKVASADYLEENDYTDLNKLIELVQEEDIKALKNIINIDNFINWNVHALLSGSRHQDNSHNGTIFFNNALGQFEFVPEDVNIFELTGNPNLLKNDLVDLLLTDEEILKKRNSKLAQYVNDERNLEEDLEFLEELFQKIKVDIYSDNQKRYGNIIYDIEYLKFKRIVKDNIRELKEILANETSDIYKTFPYQSAGNFLEANSQKYIIDQSRFQYFDKISDIVSFEKENSIFEVNHDQKEITLSKGYYNIKKTIIIPKGYTLIISEGTRLRLGEDISILSYSNVIAEGTVDRPIIFERSNRNKAWGAVAVIGAEGKNSFNHCNFSGGGNDHINGVLISGMLAIHYSEATVENSIFSEALGDDALNIKGAKALISNNKFINNSFDAIDLDWGSSSTIDNNIFINNGDDSIDIGGGNNILIINNRIENSTDKCISVGENTDDLIIFNNVLLGCFDGLAIKDNSDVVVINNTIADNQRGIALYEKKPIFGGAKAKVYNSIIWGSKIDQVYLDSGSEITVKYCDIESGFSGKGNIDIDPEFNAQYIPQSLDLDLIKGGNDKYLKDLNIELDEVPIGAINAL